MKNLIYLTQSDEYSFSKPSLRYWLTKNLITFLTIILILLPQQSCNTTEPPGNQTLKLELEDVSCTEAWLQLTTTNLQLPTTVNVLKNNSVAQTFSLSTADTLLYIDSLLPNKNYSFQVSSIQSATGGPVSPEGTSSNELSVTTMDTTSHNFTWQTFTFGDAGAGSSVLYDVAIINENDIWAVGEINIADTSINGYTTYNAVHWDGTKWELLRIPYNYNGQNYYSGIRAIYAFNKNDIWFGIASLIRWNGIEYKSIDTSPFFPALINKMWGSSSEDFYIVGNNGNIAHWDGRKWTKIESGTTLNVNDIWGDYNEKTQEWEILAVAANVNSSVERALIKISNNTSQIISSSPIQWSLRTIWFKVYKQYYIAGSGIYSKHSLVEELWANRPLDITSFYTNRIRGNDINDLIGVGAFGDLVHFNGWQWKTDYTQPSLNFGSYLSVDFRNNILVAVGLEYNQAVILIGIR